MIDQSQLIYHRAGVTLVVVLIQHVLMCLNQLLKIVCLNYQSRMHFLVIRFLVCLLMKLTPFNIMLWITLVRQRNL